jgi:hypothetical protein
VKRRLHAEEGRAVTLLEDEDAGPERGADGEKVQGEGLQRNEDGAKGEEQREAGAGEDEARQGSEPPAQPLLVVRVEGGEPADAQPRPGHAGEASRVRRPQLAHERDEVVDPHVAPGHDLEEGGVAPLADELALDPRGEQAHRRGIGSGAGEGRQGLDAGHAGIGGDRVAHPPGGVPARLPEGERLLRELQDHAQGQGDSAPAHVREPTSGGHGLHRPGEGGGLGEAVARPQRLQAQGEGRQHRRRDDEPRVRHDGHPETAPAGLGARSRRSGPPPELGELAGAGEEPREQGHRQQHREAHGEEPPHGNRADLVQGDEEHRPEADRHRRPRDRDRPARPGDGALGGDLVTHTRGARLSEARDHEERVVDAEAESQHRGHALREGGERPVRGQRREGPEREGDRQQPGEEGDEGGAHGAEREHEEPEGQGKGTPLRVAGLLRTEATQIQVERRRSRDAGAEVGVGGTEALHEAPYRLAQGRDDVLGTAGGVEADQDEGAALPVEERIAPVEARPGARDPRDPERGFGEVAEEGVAAAIPVGQPGDHEHEMIGKGRREPLAELRLDRGRLAPLHTGGHRQPLAEVRSGGQEARTDHEIQEEQRSPVPDHEPGEGRPVPRCRLRRFRLGRPGVHRPLPAGVVVYRGRRQRPGALPLDRLRPRALRAEASVVAEVHAVI